MGFFALLSSYGSVQARLLALGFSATLNDLLGMSVLCNVFFQFISMFLWNTTWWVDC